MNLEKDKKIFTRVSGRIVGVSEETISVETDAHGETFTVKVDEQRSRWAAQRFLQKVELEIAIVEDDGMPF